MYEKWVPKTALKIIKTIQQDTAYANASYKLKTSVKTNKELCQKEIKNSMYDYSWLSEYKDISNSVLIWDHEKIDALLSAAIPELSIPFSSNEEILWKDEIKRYLTGPGKEDIKIIDDRYVVFSGILPHSATNRALFWCDIKEKISAVATCEYEDDIYITSRSFTYDKLPQKFCESLSNWFKTEEIETSRLLFFSSNGLIWPLRISK